MHTLDDKIRSKNTHSRDTDSRLCGSIRGAKAGEDNGRCAAHGTEEGLSSSSSVLILHLCRARSSSERRSRGIAMRHCIREGRMCQAEAYRIDGTKETRESAKIHSNMLVWVGRCRLLADHGAQLRRDSRYDAGCKQAWGASELTRDRKTS